MSNIAHSIADSPLMFLFVRIMITTLFWSEVFLGLINFNAFAGEVQRVGLPCPRFVAAGAIVLQGVASFLIITDFNQWGWYGAGALSIFTLLTIPFGHAFWRCSEPRRTQELHFVLEHISLVGGLLLLIMIFWMNSGITPV